MRENVLKQMADEINGYRNYLISGSMTAEQIVEESYQFVVKQGIYNVFITHKLMNLSEAAWKLLSKQEHIVDYLYSLWLDTDVDLAEEFAGIMFHELNKALEVSGR